MLIELSRISRSFGTFQALADVSLELPPGRIGLLGPNGAGKSTLLKILMGLIAPSSGSGRVLDQPISSSLHPDDGFELRRQIGFMPEADALIPGLTGVDYVTLAGELCGMPRKDARRRSHEVLSYLELDDARYRRLEEYSTGMKQRLKLAQALIHDPPLLLLDEPTSGLDPASRDGMLRLLVDLGKNFGKSMIFSTHLLADVETVCERVVILLGGQVRGNGTVAEPSERRHNRWRIFVQEGETAFRASLANAGVAVLEEKPQGDWRIETPEGFPTSRLFRLASESSTLLRGIRPDEETLEEMFLRTALG